MPHGRPLKVTTICIDRMPLLIPALPYCMVEYKYILCVYHKELVNSRMSEPIG